MSTIYCTFCNRQSTVSKYTRYLCDQCHMAFVAGRKYGAKEIKTLVVELFQGGKK